MPKVRIRVAALLHSYTRGNPITEVEASTVGEGIAALDRCFPGLEFRIIDEQRRIRPHMNIFLGEEKVQDLATPVTAGEEIFIVGALSGG
jgi:molybdopterin converting factor small subunit